MCEPCLCFRLLLNGALGEEFGDVAVIGIAFRLLVVLRLLGCEVLVGLNSSMQPLELTGFAWPTTSSHHVILTLRVVLWSAVPFLSPVIGVPFTHVVDYEVVLVQAVPDDLLVPVFINFLVQLL